VTPNNPKQNFFPYPKGVPFGDHFMNNTYYLIPFYSLKIPI